MIEFFLKIIIVLYYYSNFNMSNLKNLYFLFIIYIYSTYFIMKFICLIYLYNSKFLNKKKNSYSFSFYSN